MTSFNPFSTWSNLARCSGDNQWSSSRKTPSESGPQFPYSQAIGAASYDKFNNVSVTEDISLDDFDKHLLAQSLGSEKKHAGAVQNTSINSISRQEQPHHAVNKAMQYGHLKHPFSLSASPDGVLFSSPTIPLKRKAEQAMPKRDGPRLRNSFHEKLELSRQVDNTKLQNNTEGAERLRAQAKRVKGPIIRGIETIPTTSLPDKQRSIFEFSVFNVVQSRCFPTAYSSDDNIVVSAPTGSGKTVIMELGILRIIESLKSGGAKVVYQAPTKSLCNERFRDWQAKFGVFDIQCAELTGDTEMCQLRSVAKASIIVTTPEKWDSVTRKWNDNAKLMNMIQLFLVDEVHILKDTRGATLEAIVSRMKAVGNNIRFIALSATIPNSEDVAIWLTRNEKTRHLPAIREVFDDSFRPVQLKKHILGHDGPYNPFQFDAALTQKIPNIIAQYGKRKPVMIFCATRKSAQDTANQIAQFWLGSAVGRRAWDAPKSMARVENETLQKILPAAVAFHHASLSPMDKIAVEQGFLKGDINVICSTSTLAVGVNLPCYLVILKGTHSYTDAGLQEHSSLEVMQMLGRAGRPQFETEACAVILCLNDRLSRYEKMVGGTEVLESSLHRNLIEHLNAEVSLGTVDSVESAKKWLSGSFLNVRLQKNPQYYSLESGDLHISPDDALLQWCEKNLNLLRDACLIEGNDTLRSTEYGNTMARYCIKFETMKTFMAVPAQAKLSDILIALCQATEFREFRMRQGDKAIFKEINKANEIRYPTQVDIALMQHKVSLIIQAKLGCVAVGKGTNTKFNAGHNRQFSSDTNAVINLAKRLIRCIVDILVQRNDSNAVKSALELARGLAAGVWDGTVLQLKQIPSLGDVSTRKLASAGIKRVEELFTTEPHRIEVILSKKPPFGLELLKKVSEFPMLHITVRECGQKRVPGKGVDVKIRCEVGFLNKNVPPKFNNRPYSILFLCETSHSRLIDFRRFGPSRLQKSEEILLTPTIDRPGTKLRCHVMCDDIAGTHQFAELEIKCPVAWFPSELPGFDTLGRRSKRKIIRAAEQSSEEFDFEGVNDSDLLAAMHESRKIDIVEDIDDIMAEDDDDDDKLSRKRSLTASTNEENDTFQEPQKLPNGRWTCQHACKDKGKQCKHKCCLEGVVKKPTRKLRKKDTSTTSASLGGHLKTRKTEAAGQQSTQKGPLDKLLQRSGKGKPSKTLQEPTTGHGSSGSASLLSRVSSQTDERVQSKSSDRVTGTNQRAPSPQQVSDAFDLGDFDWKAMDEIAAIFEQEQVMVDGFREYDKQVHETSTGQSKQTMPFSDAHAAQSNHCGLLTKSSGSSSPSKEAMSYGDVASFTPSHNDSGSRPVSVERTFPHHTQTELTNDSPNVQTSASLEGPASTDHLVPGTPSRIVGQTNAMTETDYHREQRLEEEDQKRRWAELDSDVLTYVSWGKYITIVDTVD